MGMFKQMKDMRSMVHDAPERIANAQALAAQAQELAAAQQAANARAIADARSGASMPTAPAGPSGPELEPISGVTLEHYAQITKAMSGLTLDEAGTTAYITSQGIDPASWAAAVDGWNARMKSNVAVATQYTNLYTRG